MIFDEITDDVKDEEEWINDRERNFGTQCRDQNGLKTHIQRGCIVRK